MSITGVTPNLAQTAKSFWDRREGKFGKGVLILGGITGAALFVYFWGLIVPFLAATAASTVSLAISIGILCAFIYVVTNKTFKTLVKNMFQLSMRWMTGLVIEVDPIGILRNYVDEMKTKKDELDKNISDVQGAKVGLEKNIEKQMAAIRADKYKLDEAKKEIAATKDPIKQNQLTLQIRLYDQDAGMKMAGVEKKNALLAQTVKILNLLRRWQQLADYNIQNTTNQVDNLSEERKSLLAATKALSAASRLIKGDPEELKILDQTLEFLADDTARKLGAMEDFSEFSEKFLTNMDVEQGAAAADAESKFAQFEQKFLSAGGTGSSPIPSVIDMTQNSQGTYVPVGTNGSSDYSNLFKG